MRRGFRRLIPWALLCAGLAGCARMAPPDDATFDPPAVCYSCFWEHQDPAFREELIEIYEGYSTDDPLVRADVEYLLARVRDDGRAVCRALLTFEQLRRSTREPSRRLVVDETLAFTAGECGRDPAPYFGRAARTAAKLGLDWKASVYREMADGTFEPAFGDAPIETDLDPPEGVEAFVLGESAIRVAPGSRVGVQIERTVRDWLSYQMMFDFTADPDAPPVILGYHEGARLQDLLAAVPLEVSLLSGALVVRRDGRWFASDGEGVFRFEVLPDKIQYPTTRARGDLALLVDTHGIAALVERAVREESDLVIGCGDHTGKVQAAYHLASMGVDVYFPCDRFVGELLGHDAEGVLLGSAPVRSEGGEAVIGDRPVRLEVDEAIVVEDSQAMGPYQYYDAPARYFRALAEALPLRLELVEVAGPGDSTLVVARARQVGASVIAVRVETEGDYEPVRDWLQESVGHRAVLFHSAPYAPGYRLFEEFPGQTTFGDPRPRFIVPEG